MELLWTAFVLGLIGSLHCAGMCGPLAMALPVVGNTRLSFTAGRLLYNAGRLLTYCAIGALFGVLGRSLSLAGMQRWVSIGAGVLIFIGLLLSTRAATKLPAWQTVAFLKRTFGALLRQRTFGSMLLLGAINGLLPCGLVYVAAAGATATGAITTAIVYMIAFGLGTLPVMLGLGLAGKGLQLKFRFRLQKLIPVSVAALALLLVMRGMSLGIPYLSPDLSASSVAVSCH
ncbi:MAG TPA: sulfite exporter TauE/SafE family protein [Candidatus Acidoferrum sp.]|nr:sulfite exporter TauE/SafE family protein [Candidatus Acidoferrum sp.]